MAYILSDELFNKYIKQLKKQYRVFAPIIKNGKGKFAETDVIGYGEIDEGKDIVFDKKSYFSPKEVFYPVRETLFYFLKNKTSVPEIEETPIIIFLRPCDINGIKRLDKIFLENGKFVDFYYQRRRNNVKFFMIECVEGFENCFCTSMGTNSTEDYDAVIRKNSKNIEILLKDEFLFQDCLDNIEEIDMKVEFIKENKVSVKIPAVEAINDKLFENPLWTEYTQRCIACGRCNTSCVTCSCFTMQDVMLSDDNSVAERRRVWASCHIDGFTDMAGGHSFRKPHGDKMRFKTMHKINDFYRRFNEHMCVGCGRCDDVCPEYISFSKCINKLNTITEEENKDV